MSEGWVIFTLTSAVATALIVYVFLAARSAERRAFQRGSEHGQRFEREAIVAWLDKSGMFLSGVAAAIERGEHLRGDDE